MKNGKSDCPFCSSDIQNRFVSSNELVFAIYDQYPVSKGHLLVIPNRHCDNYFLLSADEQQACWSLIKEMQEKLSNEFHPAGFNIGVNVGAAAGQTVGHVHIHLIPRFEGDMKDPRGGVRHCVEGKGYY
jgi:diadenosine tetraphosphate (Ap4A) HIT family hydrolase